MTLRRRHGQTNILLFLTVLPITPLVDVALVLVVFLIACVEGGKEPAHALPVALPKAGSSAPAATGALAVYIDRAGAVRVAGRDVTPAELAIAAKGARLATIHADAKVAHGTVVGVVDTLRRAGVGTIAYATTPGAIEW